MPETKFQDVVFSILMILVMVYAMELYNIALEAGGLTNEMFLWVFKDLIPMVCIVFVLEKVIAGPLAKRFTFNLFTPGKDKPIFIILSISCFTVCMMCPMMSLVATLIFKQPGNQLIAVWIETAVKNFPVALFWQIFFAGPLVRFLFRKIFAKQLKEVEAQ